MARGASRAVALRRGIVPPRPDLQHPSSEGLAGTTGFLAGERPVARLGVALILYTVMNM